MEATSGEAQDAALGLVFDRRLKLEFHGTRITSDGGLLACRELDDTLGLSDTVSGWLGRDVWPGPPVEVCAGFELIVIENATALGHDVLEISKRGEVVVGEWLVDPLPGPSIAPGPEGAQGTGRPLIVDPFLVRAADDLVHHRN